jgi:hypothetical protein
LLVATSEMAQAEAEEQSAHLHVSDVILYPGDVI